MKAIVYEKYGSPDVLEMKEIAKPVPGNDEVLIKVHATALNAFDWHLMRADPFPVRASMGFFKPKNPVLGADVAGVVEATGRNVTQFQPGDAVLGDLSSKGGGGFAEYATANVKALAKKPDSLGFAEAAGIPMAALTALQALRDEGQLQPGQKVLINGASGGVGTFAVQIAKAMGAEVTAVCSTAKMEMTRKLGADHVIDYTREDFTQNGQQYDLILGVNGDRSLSDYEQSLTPTGTYVMAGGSTKQIFQAVLLGSFKSKKDGKRMTGVSAKPNTADLNLMLEMIEAGKVTVVIDRCYPFAEVPDAMRYLEEGHARGKIIINMDAAARA